MRFTPGELKVMTVLWQHGELTPPQLLELFPEPMKDPALRSYLTILVEKGHLRRRRMGKAYAYKAVTQERSAFSGMIQQLAEAFGDGSMRSLMLYLAKQEKLTHSDIDEIREAAGLKPLDSPPVVEAKSVKRSRKKGAK